ncbi:hypothetical protein JAAARDRAFT_147496 [Jaapia argillacea MUCL 33604]|uniref:EthD domain-containing protein n=1 Tax=Jaapia argillacea MUCL 33604 TaxID=933084 RepID=A0A067QIG1_9AGAM|nr:hypothetical protein JAAARDRAFT_147496 [Jaapia argillacea MUCL 33604]
MAPKAFLLVFAEPGAAVPDAEFHDWYDNEHIPLRVNTPAFLNWTRWVEVDGAKPTWAASYDIESFAAMQKPPYTTLAETRSAREKDLLSRIAVLDRRTYEAYEGYPVHPPSALFDEKKPASVVVFNSNEVKPEMEEEYNKWYDEEHIPMLAKVPGWIRSRRFVLKEAQCLGTEGSKSQKKPPKFLAMHEWESDGFANTEEYKAAAETEWRLRMVKEVINKERRVFQFHKKWDRE